MKYTKLTGSIIIGLALLIIIVSFYYFNSDPKEALLPSTKSTSQDSSEEQQQTDIVLETRPGDAPNVTKGIPHIQLNQTSSDAIYDKLIVQTYEIDGVIDSASQASLPGARAIAVAPELQINQNAMIVGREFAHIHASPGRGSLHLVLSANNATIVVDKGWGVYHPFALNGTLPGMVMVFAPRNAQDLDVINSIINSSFEFATL